MDDLKTTTVDISKSELMENARMLGYKYEQDSYMCPQATLAALMDVFHIRDDNLFKAAFGFHGGGARTSKGLCGSLVGGILMISYFFGRNRTEFDLKMQNDQATGINWRLMKYFEEEYGGIQCIDIHKKLFGRTFDLWDPKEKKIFLDMGGHTKKCPEVIGKGAAWTAGLLWDEFVREERIKAFRRK